MSKRKKVCFTLDRESLQKLEDLSGEMEIAKSRLVDLAVEKPRKFEVISETFEADTEKEEV